MVVVFIFQNSYQQYYSEFIASKIQLNNSSIIFVSHGIDQPLFLENSNKRKIIHIDKSSFSISSMIKDNRSVLFLKNIFIDQKVTEVFFFHDHNYFNSRLIKVLSKINISTHLIEEGLSMYAIKNLNSIKSHGLITNIKYRVRQLLFFIAGSGLNIEEFGMNPYLTSIHAFEPDLLPEIKRKTRIHHLPYQIWDKKVKVNLFIKFKNPLNLTESGILYLSQPFVLLKRRTLEEQLFFMQNMIDLINNLGFKVILKTHPLEDVDMYLGLKGNFIILNQRNLPVELIIPMMSLKAVLSEGSSASVNASRTFNLKSIILKSIDSSTLLKVDRTLFDKLIEKYCTVINMNNNGFEKLKKELAIDLNEMNLPVYNTKFDSIDKIIKK